MRPMESRRGRSTARLSRGLVDACPANHSGTVRGILSWLSVGCPFTGWDQESDPDCFPNPSFVFLCLFPRIPRLGGNF